MFFSRKSFFGKPANNTLVRENPVEKNLFQKVVPKEVLDEWDELNATKIKIINTLNSKDLVKNPYAVNNLNDSFMAQHSAFGGGLGDDDEKINRRYNELKQEIKISCVQEFGLSENNITTFTPDWSHLNRPAKTNSFIVSSANDSAQMFEQICQQRESMNFSAGPAQPQAEDDDVWVTKEIKFANASNEFGASAGDMFEKSKDDNMFDMFKKDTHRREASHSSSSSSSSSDEDGEDPVKPNKKHHQSHASAAQPPSLPSDKSSGGFDTKNISSDRQRATTANNKTATNLFGDDEDEFVFESTVTPASTTTTSPSSKKDILPIDTDPWAQSSSSASSASSSSSSVETATTTPTTTASLFPDTSKSDEQSWANFENMT